MKQAISVNNAGAFRGRLQRLQKAGVPSGAKSGRGVPAKYGWNQMFQIGLAVECLELGILTERAAYLIGYDFDSIALKMARHVDCGDELGYFIVRGGGLDGLKDDGNIAQKVDFPLYVNRMEASTIFDMRTPLSMIDLEQFLVDLYEALESVTELTKDELSASFKSWAREVSS